MEYIDNKDGLDGLASFLSRGKCRIHYLPFPEGREEGLLDPDEVETIELPTYRLYFPSSV